MISNDFKWFLNDLPSGGFDQIASTCTFTRRLFTSKAAELGSGIDPASGLPRGKRLKMILNDFKWFKWNLNDFNDI